MKQFVYSPFCDNNLVPFHQWESEIVLNCAKVYRCFSHDCNQALRLTNTSTYEKDFDKHILKIKSWFLERGYSKQITDSQMDKVKFSQRLRGESKQACVGFPFAKTYHAKLKKIAKKLERLLY